MKSLIVSGGPVSRPDYRDGGETIAVDHVVSSHLPPSLETLHAFRDVGLQRSMGATGVPPGDVRAVIPALACASHTSK